MTHSIETLAEALARIESQIDENQSAYMSEHDRLSAKASVVRKALWDKRVEAGTVTADEATTKFVALRDKRAELKKRYDREDEEVKKQMQRYELWLMDVMDDVGMSSLKAEGGTAFIQTKSRYNCSDWEEYYRYIKENDRFDLLEKRPAQGPLSEMLKEGEVLPPGISTYSERVVTVRRS